MTVSLRLVYVKKKKKRLVYVNICILIGCPVLRLIEKAGQAEILQTDWVVQSSYRVFRLKYSNTFLLWHHKNNIFNMFVPRSYDIWLLSPLNRYILKHRASTVNAIENLSFMFLLGTSLLNGIMFIKISMCSDFSHCTQTFLIVVVFFIISLNAL